MLQNIEMCFLVLGKIQKTDSRNAKKRATNRCVCYLFCIFASFATLCINYCYMSTQMLQNIEMCFLVFGIVKLKKKIAEMQKREQKTGVLTFANFCN